MTVSILTAVVRGLEVDSYKYTLPTQISKQEPRKTRYKCFKSISISLAMSLLDVRQTKTPPFEDGVIVLGKVPSAETEEMERLALFGTSSR